MSAPSDLRGEFEGPAKSNGKARKGPTLDELAAMRRTLDARILELNERHAILMLGGRCVVMNEIVDPVFGRPDISFSNIADFKAWYGTDLVQVPGERGSKLMPIAHAWLQSPERRQHKGIVFSPGGDIEDHYNLWKGFAVEPRQGDWRRCNEHIHEIICAGNDRNYDYLLDWMARLVQDPGGTRPGVSIVLKGGRGVGKGTFVDEMFGRIFGSHFLQVMSAHHFTGRFNQHLKDCLLLFVDEGFWAGDKSAEGLLKGMITEFTIWIEPKGKDQFKVKNHINLIIASNNEWIIPAGFDERRFLMLEVSDGHKQDHAYFEKIKEELAAGGREAMLYDLLRRDISGVNLRAVPTTRGLTEQKLFSSDSVTKFWQSRLSEGLVFREDIHWEDPIEAETQKLYDDYVKFARNLGFTRIEDDAIFSRTLRRICPGIRGPRRVTGANGKRIRVVELPCLDDCRSDFDRIIGDRSEWERDDVRKIVI